MALTGPLERLTAVAKAFRIYISTVPADAEDYLVDHSICLYLMDTNGQILEYFGQHMTAEESIIKAVDLIQKDQAALKAGDKKQM
jgi:protein SCO1/2